MSRKLNPSYVSPHDLSPLEEREGELRSASGDTYPVVDGIARFAESGYAAAFGNQWIRFARTQLDSHTGRPVSRERLLRILGGGFEPVAGKRVLEVGSGAGRFTEILAEHAAELYTLDMSNAIEANRRNNGNRANIRFAQASVYELPFADDSFDAAICIGMIQHTPDPARTLAGLARKVRPGGLVAVDFYRLRLSFLTRFGLNLARLLLRGLPPDRSFAAVTRLYELFEPIHRRFGRSLIGYLLLTRLSPIVTYYHRKDFGLSENDLRDWGYLDTHDSLTDRYKHLFTIARVRRLCEACGLRPVRLEPGGNGIELLARRE